jgi:hypothetical protein
MIYFTPRAWSLVRAVLQLADTEMNGWEVQGYGRIEVISPRVAIVDDIAMPEQIASASFIETDAEQYTAWQREHFKLSGGMSDAEIEAVNTEQDKWRFWWHYHGSMTASYSNTDWEQLKQFAESYGLFFGAVFDNKMNSKAYAAYCQPAMVAVEWGNCELFLPDEPGIDERAKEMFAAVTKKSYTSSPVIWKGGDGRKEAGGTPVAPLASGSKSGNANGSGATPSGDDVDDSDDVDESGLFGYASRGCFTCMGLLQRWEVSVMQPDGSSTFQIEFVCDDCDLGEDICSCLNVAFHELEMGGHI